MKTIDTPPLVQYGQLSNYVPIYGDYVIWSGYVTTWHGVVTNYDPKTDELYIIFAGVPLILFTMDEKEQNKETKKIKLSKIKNAPQGNFAIQQHNSKKCINIWYI